MNASEDAAGPDWLDVCRAVTARMEEMLAAHPSTDQRAIETGRGEGGDEALVIDRLAEEMVFAELDALSRAGHRFTAVSEERGAVDYGSADTIVVIDPIDGSLNAKRCLTHFSVSIAVAAGPTIADVFFGYVYDFGAREEWSARRGAGAWLNGSRLDPATGERRTPAGALEIVAIESADPRWVADCAPRLLGVTHRLRAIGSIAIALCQLAAGRVDGMLTLWRCRSVDAAAAALIVLEAGGFVAFTAFTDPLAAPLDLAPHSPVVAARSRGALAELAGVPSSS